MSKKIKLSSKKPEKKPHKDTYFFFVKDQGEGAVRVIIIILKLLELMLTTIYGVCLGIIAPLSMRYGVDDPEIANDPAAIIWLISSILYIAGLFVVIFNRAKIATVIHLLASVGTMTVYGRFLKLYGEYSDTNGPTGLIMPCLFITLMTIAIMLLINVPIWFKSYVEKQNEVAPSILGDDDPPEK